MRNQEFADHLNGNQIGSEGSKELFQEMAEAGYVAVFGASDDLMEFRGAIDDEVGCCDGGTAYLNEQGLLENECDNEDCPAFSRAQDKAETITAIWCPPNESLSWAYKTDIAHATFEIVEDGEIWCRGIVFQLSDAWF